MYTSNPFRSVEDHGLSTCWRSDQHQPDWNTLQQVARYRSEYCKNNSWIRYKNVLLKLVNQPVEICISTRRSSMNMLVRPQFPIRLDLSPVMHSAIKLLPPVLLSACFSTCVLPCVLLQTEEQGTACAIPLLPCFPQPNQPYFLFLDFAADFFGAAFDTAFFFGTFALVFLGVSSPLASAAFAARA